MTWCRGLSGYQSSSVSTCNLFLVVNDFEILAYNKHEIVNAIETFSFNTCRPTQHNSSWHYEEDTLRTCVWSATSW